MRKFIICLIVLGIFSCGKEEQPFTSVKVVFDPPNKELSPKALPGGWGVAPPTNINQVNCFAVAVEVPETNLDSQQCIFAGGGNAMKPVVIDGFKPITEELSLLVPSGPNRIFKVIGVKSTGACPDFSSISLADKTILAPPAILGETTASLDPGVATVEIVASLNNPLGLFNCFNGVFSWQLNNFTQGAYLKAFNSETGDKFGSKSVATNGDRIVVGAPLEDSSATTVNGDETDNLTSGAGAAYVFRRSGDTWVQEAYLKPSVVSNNGQFGSDVDINAAGDTIVVGAAFDDFFAGNAGAAYVFVRSGTIWTFQQQLLSADLATSDSLGRKVAISGETIVLSARVDDSATGSAYVFTRTGTTWTEQAKLTASNLETFDEFGSDVDIDGDTIIVGAGLEASAATGVNGAQTNGAPQSGAAYVFTRSGAIWTQQAYLKASNTENTDKFGTNVAISGDTVAVGAFQEDGPSTNVGGAQGNGVTDSGAVYVFHRVGTTWSQQAYVKASNTGNPDGFSNEGLDIKGDLLVVGAADEDGSSTGLDGVDDNLTGGSGAAYIYERSGATWTFKHYVKASTVGLGDKFGQQVAISDSNIVIGASGEQSNATTVNGDETNDTNIDFGAVWVFERKLP